MCSIDPRKMTSSHDRITASGSSPARAARSDCGVRRYVQQLRDVVDGTPPPLPGAGDELRRRSALAVTAERSASSGSAKRGAAQCVAAQLEPQRHLGLAVVVQFAAERAALTAGFGGIGPRTSAP